MKYNLQFLLLKYTTLSSILCSITLLLLTIDQTVYCQRQGVYDDSTISEIEIDIDILNIPSFILNGTNNSDLSILNNNVSISDRIIRSFESDFLYMGIHITQIYQDVSYISQVLFINNYNNSILFLNQSSQCIYNKDNVSNISITRNNTNYTDSDNSSNPDNNIIDYFCMMKYENSNVCDVCIPGFTIRISQSTFCVACPMGYFKSEYGTGDCLPCQKGWSTFGLQGQISCRPCLEGTSTNGLMGQSSCSNCVEFSEAVEKASSICKCVNGTSLDYTGNKCIMCTPGNYNIYNPFQSLESQDRCFSCDVGTYSSHRGSTYCEICPPGTFNPTKGATDCILCEINSFNAYWGQSQCKQCEIGSYNDLTGSNLSSCTCAVGTEIYRGNNITGNVEIKCLLCSAGKYQPFNNTSDSLDIVCRDCEPGTYTSEMASSSCSLCPPNQYENRSGSTSCLECKKYSIIPSNASGGSSSCECIPGTSNNYDNTKCIPCPTGFFQSQYNSDVCEKCPIFSTTTKVGANSSQYCTYCLPGSSLFSSSENNNTSYVCTVCEPGFYQPMPGTENLCIPCPPGSYSDVYASQNCNLCYQNTFSEHSGSSTCFTCPLYSENNQNGSTLCKCVIGTSTLSNNSNDNKSCIPCLPGSYQPLNSTTCLSCEPGSYSLFSKTMSSCTKCPINTFSENSGSTECFQCENYSQTLEIGSSRCECIMGAVPNHFGKCIPCIPGSYQPFLNSDYCKLCEPGTYSSIPGTMNNCTSCTINTFSENSGSTECFQCENYSQTLEIGSSRCNCTMGAAPNHFGKCMPCISGSYQPTDSTSCKLCEPGTYSSMPGTMHNCTQCTINTFSGNSGSTECFQCKRYSETFNIGSSQCECVIGANLNYLGTSCIPCIPGTFQGNGICSPCSIGTYNLNSSATMCIDCPIGSFNLDLGSTSCLKCLENSIFSIEKSKCTCDTGKFNLTVAMFDYSNNTIHNNSLVIMPLIITENLNISNNLTNYSYWKCETCKENCSIDNYYISRQCTSDADIVCSPCKSTCQLGTYLKTNCTYNQDTICKTCASSCIRGYYTKSKCTNISDMICEACFAQCPPGHILLHPCTTVKNIICEKCPMGTYIQSNAIPSSFCVGCLPGYITSNLQDDCIKCEVGWYTNANKTLCVKQCLAGSYPSNINTCLLCPRYSYNTDGISCITCMGCGLNVLSEGATSCSTCNIQDYNNNNNNTINPSIDNTCKIIK